MTGYLLRRLAWAVVLFFAATFATYVIFYVIPDDPARTIAGRSATPAQVVEARHYIGTDRPIVVQYYRFVKRIVVDRSLGRSFLTRQSVNSTVFAAARKTASIVIGGAILWLLISIPIGILSALRPRSLLDRTATGFVLLGVSAHPVWIGLIFSYLVGYKLGWTPISGYCTVVHHPDAGCGGPTLWASHLILPWITFALVFAALYVRLIRASVLETMHEDYVRTARAKGASEWRVLRSHVLRNAMLPVVTILGLDVALALGGAIFTESVFSIQGLGVTALSGYSNADLPITIGIVVFATICVILANLIVDIAYAYIDPRIRISA
jgi:peptide/nickel transport system permease protein